MRGRRVRRQPPCRQQRDDHGDGQIDRGSAPCRRTDRPFDRRDPQGEQQWKDERRRLAQHRQHEGHRPQPPATRQRDLRVAPQRGDHTQRRQDLAALDHVVDGLRPDGMHRIDRDGGQRHAVDVLLRRRHLQCAPEQPPHHQKLQEEPDERVQLEHPGHVAAGQPIIEGECGLQHRPVRLVLRQHTEGGRVREILRQVAEVADERVVEDGVAVVEVEAVLEMVGVSPAHQGGHSDDRQDVRAAGLHGCGDASPAVERVTVSLAPCHRR